MKGGYKTVQESLVVYGEAWVTGAKIRQYRGVPWCMGYKAAWGCVLWYMVKGINSVVTSRDV